MRQFVKLDADPVDSRTGPVGDRLPDPGEQPVLAARQA